MMDAVLHYLPLFNVFVLPGLVVLWRAARAVERAQAFMEESRADRARLHLQVDRIEREMMKRGMYAS